MQICQKSFGDSSDDNDDVLDDDDDEDVLDDNDEDVWEFAIDSTTGGKSGKSFVESHLCANRP